MLGRGTFDVITSGTDDSGSVAHGPLFRAVGMGRHARSV